MGDRANVRLEYGKDHKPIFLYTHWAGTELPKIVATALARVPGRWDDPSYLARAIFDEMIRGIEHEETGAGISPYRPDHEHPDVVVDLENKTANGKSYQEFIDNPKARKAKSGT